MGLKDPFAAVRSHITLMDPLQTLNCTFSMVLQQEKATSSFSRIFVNAMNNEKLSGIGRGVSYRRGRGGAFNFKGIGRGNGKMCIYCGKSGHTVDSCYK